MNCTSETTKNDRGQIKVRINEHSSNKTRHSSYEQLKQSTSEQDEHEDDAARAEKPAVRAASESAAGQDEEHEADDSAPRGIRPGQGLA